MPIGGTGVAGIASPPVGLDAFRDYAADLRDSDKLLETLDQIEQAKAAAIKEIERARDTMLTVAEEKQTEAITARNEANSALQDARAEASSIVGAAKTQAAQIVAQARTDAEALTKGARSAAARAGSRMKAAEEKEATNRRTVDQHAQLVEREHEEITGMRHDIEVREQDLADQKEKVAAFFKQLQELFIELTEG